jgi:hypothetical protein
LTLATPLSEFYPASLLRYYARVQTVYLPRSNIVTDASAAPNASSSTSPPPPPLKDERPHMIAGDLKIPVKDINALDDPTKYYYGVQILELEKDKGHDKGRSASKSTGKEGDRTGSITEVQCQVMRYVCISIRICIST